MSIWTRHGLSFTSQNPPPPASPLVKEHLDVLVLNGASYFIDLRVRLSATGVEIERSDLDWGFGGTRKESVVATEQGEDVKTDVDLSPLPITYCRWSTTVCSRTKPGEPILLDEGLLYRSPEYTTSHGGTFYERGDMINPDTGVSEDGEEVWNEIMLGKGGKSVDGKWNGVIFLERSDGGAFVGCVGDFSIGIGRRVMGGEGHTSVKAEDDHFWMWRKDSNVLRYTMGDIEGLGMIDSLLKRCDSQDEGDAVTVLPCGTSVIDGKTGSVWTVREFSGEGPVI